MANKVRRKSYPSRQARREAQARRAVNAGVSLPPHLQGVPLLAPQPTPPAREMPSVVSRAEKGILPEVDLGAFTFRPPRSTPTMPAGVPRAGAAAAPAMPPVAPPPRQMGLLPGDTAGPRTPHPSYVNDVIKPALEAAQAAAAEKRYQAEVAREKARIPVARAVQLSGGIGAGAPVSLGFTNYDEGREKMKQKAIEEMQGVTQRLLENAQGIHFQNTRPVRGADGRVHFIKDKPESSAPDPERLEAARAMLAERKAAREAGGAVSDEERPVTDLVRQRFANARQREAEQAARADAIRQQKAEAQAEALQQVRQNILARQNPEAARVVAAQQAAAAEAAHRNKALQQQETLARLEDTRTRELADQRANQLAQQFKESQTAEAQRHAERLKQMEMDRDLERQQIAQGNDPVMIAASLAREQVAADPSISFEAAFARAYDTIVAGQKFGQEPGALATGGAPTAPATSSGPRTLSETLGATGTESIESARKSIDRIGGEGTSQALGDLAESMSTPTSNLGLSEVGIFFGYPGAQADRRAAYLASGILRAYEQGKITDQVAGALASVLRNRLNPQFISQVNDPSTQDTPYIRLLRAVLNGQPLSEITLSDQDKVDILGTNRHFWLGSPTL